MRGSLHQDVVVLGIQRVEHAVDVPDRHHRAVHHDPVRRLASLVAGLEGRPLERRLEGLHRLRLLEEGLDLAGLLLDAGDDGLEVLVGVEVGRRRRSHLAGRRRGGRFCVWVCVGPGRWSRLLSLKLRVLCSWG
jgi:hypothetical protein